MEATGNPAANDYLKEITLQAKEEEGKLHEMTMAMEFVIASADKHLDNIETSLNSYTKINRELSSTKL